ncbi:MAG TPA: tyrosinase family protein [Rhizomicrobium sp.]|jgi:tyrosinase|nr:tyrosinase family protein [Rhizomicrobium sp.]
MTKSFQIPGVSRRVFLGTATAAAGASMLPAYAAPAKAGAKYTRYSATTPQGKAMLASYGIAVGKMLKLDPTDPHCWFRNAFVHAMDCPHGNWWFFTWHRPFVGYFEEVVRQYSGNKDFAFPYWDWTKLPAIPAEMFDGPLDPTSAAYDPYISSFDTFFKHMNPAMETYWRGLSPAQLSQLNTRGMPTLKSLWDQVKGNPDVGAMYAKTPNARWITKASPSLDAKTKVTVSLPTILQGLSPTTFTTTSTVTGFNSIQTPSHNTQPSGGNVFAVLEGQPHNKTHNNIGGVGHIPNDQYYNFGYMADNLSPVDPIFFLHHSNMDRLWDVWTRKQQAQHLPYLPTGADWTTFAQEPFLFYIDANGTPAMRKNAGESVEIGGFDYDYQPGMGEAIVRSPQVVAAALAHFQGSVSGGEGSVAVPPSQLRAGKLVASITIPHPMSGSAPREFDVLINAPPGTQSVGADSPFFAGTISFFGFMPGMTSMDVTFQVPLDKLPPAAKGKPLGSLVFTVVPSGAAAPTGTVRNTGAPMPVLKNVSVSVTQ